MFVDNKILIGKNAEEELYIISDKANRHGLITGASGSGKTITLKVMAESFSEAGVPVFLADVKGDLAGMCLPGMASEKITERLNGIGITNFEYKGFPTVFWDVYGKGGHPIRTTVKNVGATILSRMLGLSEAQAGVLSIVFKIADDKNMELVDLKDLRLLLQYVGDNRKDYTIEYGNVTTQSIGAIQRGLLVLEEQGANHFFGEPSLDVQDLIKVNDKGLGNINVLHAVELFNQPNMYSSFLLWLLTYLNQNMSEVGDLEKPKMVFFLDEAHLLFDDMPNYMLTQITQVVKLIRSKGIGLYFISQTPMDIPADILAQLGNRVQHTLRAYTPAEQKIIKSVASSFRTNPSINTEEAIMSLGTGEALISFMNEKGEPNIVQKATILPPQSKMGAIDDSMRLMVLNQSPFKRKYDTIVDRETAYEKIKAELEAKQEEKNTVKEADIKTTTQNGAKDKTTKTESKATKTTTRKTKSSAEKAFERTANSALSTIGRKIGNEIIKKLFK